MPHCTRGSGPSLAMDRPDIRNAASTMDRHASSPKDADMVKLKSGEGGVTSSHPVGSLFLQWCQMALTRVVRFFCAGRLRSARGTAEVDASSGIVMPILT